MAIVRNDVQQSTANIMATDESGSQTPAASVTYSIRPGSGVSIHVDIHSQSAVEADTETITAAIAAVIAEGITAAAAQGLPVELPQESE